MQRTCPGRQAHWKTPHSLRAANTPRPEGRGCSKAAEKSVTYWILSPSSSVTSDTSFMYMIAGLCMLKLYQTRHPDINASAYAAYASFALVITLTVLGVVCPPPQPAACLSKFLLRRLFILCYFFFGAQVNRTELITILGS